MSISSDSVDPRRVNNVELWASQETLDAWRAAADPPDTGFAILDASMREYVVARSREPFSTD